MDTTRSRQATLIALLFSFLIHMGGIVVFLRTNFKDQFFNKKIVEDHATQVDDWAATKARRSIFGAPVIFRDVSSDEPISPNGHDKEEQIQQKPHEQQQMPQHTKPKMNNNISQKNNTEETTIKQDAVYKELANAQRKKQVLEKIANMLRQKHQQKTIQKKDKKIATPTQQPKKLTLAQLTQGFLQHLKDEGNHNITTIGKEGGKLTAEQLKHERYVEKISWCLQNSFKIHRHKMPLNDGENTTVEVFLALNQNGDINQLQLIKSSGQSRLDQYALYIFRDANSSFPPVPHYLPHNPYKIVFIIEMGAVTNGRFNLYMN